VPGRPEGRPDALLCDVGQTRRARGVARIDVRVRPSFRSFRALSLVRGARGHADDEWFTDLGV